MARALSAALLLLLYILPLAILPAVHAAGELLEHHDDCVACNEPIPASPAGPSVRAACAEGCSDRSHRHHNHPLHDPAHCTICMSAGNAVVVDCPTAGPELPLAEGTGTLVLPARAHVPPRATLGLEVARGPPAA